MAKTLEANDKLIRDLFEGSYQFEIPDYQRPYAWTTEQATELFDDLCSAIQDARVSGASSQYFLGSIVLIKNDREPKSSVVDGQQRLSTLTMLFAVLRTVMPDTADDITDFLYKKGKVSLGEKNEYRLTAREEDADFFRTNIQEPGGISQLVASTDKLKDSRLRYRENATLLLEKAKTLPPALTTLTLTEAQKRKFVAALDGDVYDDLPKAQMALVLRLESLVRAPGVQLQDAVSLEHVLPQTQPDGSDWIKWFPDEDERDGWTHRLANLVPLDRNKNSSASNYDFAKKKDAYFRGKGKASPFVLTQEVRSENEWTPTLLAERQKRLVGVLAKHWGLAVSTGTAAS